MKLTEISVERASGSGGLLNGLSVIVREPFEVDPDAFRPLCLIGPNGSGKSQLLQVLAEFFQAAWHACAPLEERREVDPKSAFTVRYELWRPPPSTPLSVEISRAAVERGTAGVCIRTREGDDEWTDHELSAAETRTYLPQRVVAYTSGENETLSLPFFASRLAYADEVTRRALATEDNDVEHSSEEGPQEPRLMLIDYSTHLEVLVANLLLGSTEQRRYLLDAVGLEDLRSVRCVVQLNHGPVKSNSKMRRPSSRRKGVQLTEELEGYIDALRSCATTWDYDPKREIYVFDFWVDGEMRRAFADRFDSALALYRALHKLALLNDLAISKPARHRFEDDVTKRRFAARLPEPPDQDKVFRFEQVNFYASKTRSGERTQREPVDYVSLSDGEHQLIQILGVFTMVAEPNVLFLLDEPESHFNPQWRVEFMSKLMCVPTINGRRGDGDFVAPQEALITTHAPFVPSDIPREQVLIFKRREDTTVEPGTSPIDPRRPDIQTFGASYEEILAQCFNVAPPISEIPRRVIDELMESTNAKEVEAGLHHLGRSIEKVLLADHLDQLNKS